MAIRKRNATWSSDFFLKLYYALDDFFKHFSFKFWWVFYYIFLGFLGALLTFLVNYNYTPSDDIMPFSSSHYSFNQDNYQNFNNFTEPIDGQFERRLEETYLYNIPEKIPFIDYLFSSFSVITGAALFTVPLSILSNQTFIVFSFLTLISSTNFLNLLVLFYKRYRYYKIKRRINSLIEKKLLKSVDQLSKKNKKIILEYDILIESLNLFIILFTIYNVLFIFIGGFLIYFILKDFPTHPELKVRGFNNLDNAFYLTISAFGNYGLSMTTDSLLFYYNYARLYLTLAFLILIGSTALPIFLRYFIINIQSLFNFYYKYIYQNENNNNNFHLHGNSLRRINDSTSIETLPENQNQEFYYNVWTNYLKDNNSIMNDPCKTIKDPHYYYYNLLFYYLLNNSRRITVNLFNRVKSKVLLYMLTFLILIQFFLFLLSILTFSGSFKLLSTKVSSLSNMIGRNSVLSSVTSFFYSIYSSYFADYAKSFYYFISSSPRDYYSSNFSTSISSHVISFLSSNNIPTFSPTEAPITAVLPSLSFAELSGIGFFQTFAVRAAGFTIIDLRVLNHGILFFYLILMYTAAFPFISTLRETQVIDSDAEFEWSYIKPEEIKQVVNLKENLIAGIEENVKEKLYKINPLLLKKYEMMNNKKENDINTMFLNFEKNIKKIGKQVTNKVVQNTSDFLGFSTHAPRKNSVSIRDEQTLDQNEGKPRSRSRSNRGSIYNPMTYLILSDDSDDATNPVEPFIQAQINSLEELIQGYYSYQKDEEEEKRLEEERAKKKIEEEEELTVSDKNPLSGSIIRKQFTNKFLLRHTFFLFVAVIFLLYTEDDLMKKYPSIINPFIILFEMISAYGCVGLTFGIPGECVALSGVLSTSGKLVIISLMVLGKHRGLPSSEDEVIDFKFNSLRHAHGYIEEDLEEYFEQQGDNISRFFEATSRNSDIELGSVDGNISQPLTPKSTSNNPFSIAKKILTRSTSNSSINSVSSLNSPKKTCSSPSITSPFPSMNSLSSKDSKLNSKSSSKIYQSKTSEIYRKNLAEDQEILLIENDEDEDL